MYRTPGSYEVDPPNSWEDVLVMAAAVTSLHPDGADLSDEVSWLSKASHFGMSALAEAVLAAELELESPQRRPSEWFRDEIANHLKWQQ